MNTLPAAKLVQQITTGNPDRVALRDLQITGDVNLAHREIDAALSLHNCQFTGSVDLRGTRFSRPVDWCHCVFSGPVNAGDSNGLGTRFSHDLLLRWCTFQGEVTLCGVRCEGSTLFTGTRFHAALPLDLSHAHFGSRLDFTDALFRGGGQFREVRCIGAASFQRARFAAAHHDADFSGASFTSVDFTTAIFDGGANFIGVRAERRASFRRARFLHPSCKVNFAGAILQDTLDCSEAVFQGPVSFEGMKVTLVADFDGAHFEYCEDTADFSYVECGIVLSCVDSSFAAGACFHHLRCDSLFLSRARFEGEAATVHLSHATIASALAADAAWFHGDLDAVGLGCRSGDFRGAQFIGTARQVNFDSARFGLNLDCAECRFAGEVSFNGIRCEGGGLFDNARFENPKHEVDFRFSSFGVNLQFSDVSFLGDVNLNSCRVGYTLHLGEAQFYGRVCLANAVVKRFWIGASFPFTVPKLDLRSFVFEVFGVTPNFSGPPDAWKQLVEAQAKEHASRDPYIQLEKHYRGTGDEVRANEIYHSGRSDLLERARTPGNSVSWSRARVSQDQMLRFLTGYGVQSWRVAVLLIAFVVIGVGVFWNERALTSGPSSAEGSVVQITYLSSATAAVPAGERTQRIRISPLETSPHQRDESFAARLFDRVLYSTDLLIPVVRLQAGETRHPTTYWRKVYAATHRLAGWLLVPLLVASLSGIIKRQ